MANFIHTKKSNGNQDIYLNLEQIVTIEKLSSPQQGNDYYISTTGTGSYSGFCVDKNEAFRIMQAVGIPLEY